MKGPHERPPSLRVQGILEARGKKVGSPWSSTQGAQTVRSRRVLQAKVICAHFPDEETEAATSLEAGAQVGRCFSLEEKPQNPQGPEKRTPRPPSSKAGTSPLAPPAWEAQRHHEACPGHTAIRTQLLPSLESGAPGRPLSAQLVGEGGERGWAGCSVPSAGRPWPGSWRPCQQLAVWPWAGHRPSLSLRGLG